MCAGMLLAPLGHLARASQRFRRARDGDEHDTTGATRVDECTLVVLSALSMLAVTPRPIRHEPLCTLCEMKKSARPESTSGRIPPALGPVRSRPFAAGSDSLLWDALGRLWEDSGKVFEKTAAPVFLTGAKK